MKFMAIFALLISSSSFAAIFDSIDSIEVIQKEVQAKNASKEDRKPASTETAPADSDENAASDESSSK